MSNGFSLVRLRAGVFLRRLLDLLTVRERIVLDLTHSSCERISCYRYRSLKVEGYYKMSYPFQRKDKAGAACLWHNVVNKTSTKKRGTYAPRAMLKHQYSFASVAGHVYDNRQELTHREKEKLETKAKLDELDDFKNKYETERKEKEAAQAKLARLSKSQTDVDQKLFRANEIIERLRTDNKKKAEKIEKYQRDVPHMEDRIRNLEIRASEVEKAELTLESTRRNLEHSQGECRVKDGEIRRLEKKLDDKSDELERCGVKMEDLNEKIRDLKLQVRQELVKNESIEKQLDSVPLMKLELEDNTSLLKDTQKECEEKTVLLTAARKTIREYKDRLRELEQRIGKTDTLEHELEVASSEVSTLKKLMTGKDYLVFQKSQAVDMAKVILETLSTDSNKGLHENLQEILKKLSISPPTYQPNTVDSKLLPNRHQFKHRRDFHSYSVDSSPRYSDDDSFYRSQSVYTPYTRQQSPSGAKSSKEGYRNFNGKSDLSSNQVFLERVISSGKQPKLAKTSTMTISYAELHPKTAVVRPMMSKNPSLIKDTRRKKFSEQKYSHQSVDNSDIYSKYKSDQRTNSPYPPSLDYSIGVPDKEQTSDISLKSKSSTVSGSINLMQSECSLAESDISAVDYLDLVQRLPSNYEEAVLKLSPKEREAVLDAVVDIGCRVVFSVAQKPPKYGKRKAPKPIIYTGLVKYKGRLDKEYFDSKIYVGLRLDEAIGDTDGLYKEKRYMYAPIGYGKFFRLRDVASIFEMQSGSYRDSKEFIAVYQLKKQDRTASEEQHK